MGSVKDITINRNVSLRDHCYVSAVPLHADQRQFYLFYLFQILFYIFQRNKTSINFFSLEHILLHESLSKEKSLFNNY